ncbi:YqzM family protein [Halalkalibacillus halophilus]|nr:YqzM family protein [Halalkalibacillus halophilus]
MNDFEKDVQSKNNDVVDSIKGFGFSFIFFFVIFFIGTIFTIFAN